MSFDEEDWATWHFMQWFVKEQTEEETLALNLLDKIKLQVERMQAGKPYITLIRIYKISPKMRF
jgi:ferritin